MNAIEVSLNGKRCCTAGVENARIVHCFTGFFCKPDGSGWGLRVSGLDDDDHLNWPVPDIKVGDEVTIRIVDAPEVDAPLKKSRSLGFMPRGDGSDWR